ncbi:head completion/stabilization protein [Azospirillum argentinense]
MTSFIPANGATSEDRTVGNDGWYPDLTVAACRAGVGLAKQHDTDRVGAELLSAMIEVNNALSEWRAGQSAASLADVPAPTYGAVSEKVTLYGRAVFCLVRARMMEVSREHDATAKGIERAELAEGTAASWRQASQEALARLTDRARTVVELI